MKQRKELKKILKKKRYILYIYYEGSQDYELITTYKERSMRNAILEHLLSYEKGRVTNYFYSDMNYNEYVMNYSMVIDGEIKRFSMIQELDDSLYE